jgi:hypothetical protein
MSEDFYIGYLPKMPKSVAKFVRIFVISVFALAIILAILLWLGQRPFADSNFEFTENKQFTGYVQAEPIPFLVVEKTEKNKGLPMFEKFPLVAEGKFGIDVSAFKNQYVSVKGKLIYRDGLKMIEVATDSIVRQETKNSAPVENTEDLGVHTLNGEIVDSKCYLGVMNPGQSKPHKECAIRCLSGGIPPLFIVKNMSGDVSELWIVADKSKFLDYVAEPVEISGEVKRQGDKLFIYLSSIKRL